MMDVRLTALARGPFGKHECRGGLRKAGAQVLDFLTRDG